MLSYPKPFLDYPTEWIEELAQFREKEDVIRLEMKDVFDYIKTPSLIAFYQRINELISLPAIPELPSFPEHKFSFLFMIPKKQHEIRKLAPFVNAFYQTHNISQVIDIGGGIGNLAQSLTNHYNLKTVSVDMDPALQKTGIERHKKNAVTGHHQVEYVNVKVDASEMKFNELLNTDSMTLGLHTCGALANYQIQASSRKKIKAIISFGCCYDKLSRDPHSQNISQAGKEQALYFKQFGLTLAARAHRKMDEKDYSFMMKVKFYRYCIHFLLHDHYDQKALLTLGNSHHSLYDQSFGVYVLEQLKRVGIKPRHTKEELDQYFMAPDRQDMLWKMMAAGLIRNAMGRAMELYILLDRACYLEEQGYKVELLEFFNETISPRNIGLVATV